MVAISFQTVISAANCCSGDFGPEIAAQAFSVSSLLTGSVVGFLQYVTSSGVSPTRVKALLGKHPTGFLFLKCVCIFLADSVYVFLTETSVSRNDPFFFFMQYTLMISS